MKIKQITETKYRGNPSGQFFVFEYLDPDDFNLVGPFPDEASAKKYDDYLKKRYGKYVHLNTDIVGITTPEVFEKSQADHYNWMAKED